MGLLTDPNCEQGKLTKALMKYYNLVCVLFYLAGIVCFLALASREINVNTYFSENALLPGLVKSEFRDDSLARRFYTELQDEMKKYDNSLPYPWLLAKFQQLGLDTYTHNFSLTSVLGKSQKFTGKNVYGILRAPRAASTESLILSVPYRPPTSPHLTTAPSIAILLAFANFAVKEKYWAKDIIFLITEHEQLGMQAWLEAYHDVQCGSDGILARGDLEGRAGVIQAAINLELHTDKIAHIDVKIEGLNGQLPNLDLFNLVTKICTKEGVYNTFKMRDNKEFRSFYKDWAHSMNTLLAMVTSQATGIPDGNHGLFHRFGIEALTIEGYPYNGKGNNWKVEFLIMGRILEGVFRSLNNLLEKFHQSFFFYLLPSSNRYVSIGHYFPSIAAIAGVLYLRACAKWCKLQKKVTTVTKEEDDEQNQKEVQIIDAHKRVQNVFFNKEKLEELKNSFKNDMKLCYSCPKKEKSQIGDVILIFFITHFIGIILMNSPKYMVEIGDYYNIPKERSIFYGYNLISCFLLVIPVFVSFRKNSKAMAVLNVIALLELGTLLICVAMNNFSLALLTGILYTPFALLINNSNTKLMSTVQRIFWLLVHPCLVLTLVVLINTSFLFSNETFQEIFYRGINATQQALVYGIVDSMIYGNWLFNIVTAIFLPNWLCFWILTFSPTQDSEEKDKLKLE
ncbi:hypothetical protein HHI36_013870 [Cryptolaemus montrouzieri]|uniref:GPI-anchor transamidase component GPAA1 n=1 Tax=Cryptolaemus montrouzieri TaxID=559131 RepID=A0ABD2N111_9CUCU